MTDDDPLDLAGVAADAAALDALLSGDELPEDLRDDLALTLLHDLRLDVDTEPIPVAPAGAPSRSDIILLSPGQPRARRAARSTTAVALLTAGALSLGGVAAASTTVAAGNPLYGLGEAVRSAAGTFVDAVTPPQTAPVPPPAPAASPTPRPTPAGVAVAASARSTAAARQVTALLDAAQELLAEGRTKQADDRLDVAERRLPEVLPADGATALAARLADLRGQVGAATASPGAPKRAEPSRPAEPTRKPAAKPTTGPKKQTEQRKPSPAQKPAREKPAVDKKPTAQPEPEPQPDKDQPDKPAGKSSTPLVQPSKDASAKPRA